MQLKKSHRFIAAFISFLLITTLCTSVFLVSAADEGEMPPSQGGVEVDTNLVDMGAIAETDLTSKTEGTFSVTNATGERLTFSKVLYQNTEGAFVESEYVSQCYNGNHFYLYGPNYIDGSSEFVKQSYFIKPFTSGSKKLTAREEPYTDTFQLVFTNGEKEYSAEVSVSLTVIQEGQHLISLTALNGHIYAYMSETIYATTDDLQKIQLEDFEITATDEDGKDVELEGLRIETRDASRNSIIIAFNDLQSDTTKVINVSVKHKDDSAAKTAEFDVEGNVTESNIPESGNVVIKVIDSETKKPVPGVPVKLICSGIPDVTATTDSDGYARFSNLQPGQYSLSIHMEGYNEVDLVSPDLTAEEIPVNLSRPGDLGSDESANIQIIVKNQYGEPVDDATVQFFCPANNGKGAAQTNAQGIATFELKANNYEITVSKSGHFDSGSKILSVTHKEEVLEITLEERFMCQVMTTVLDEDGRPVSGAEVYYTCPTDNDVGKSKTNSQGKTSEWISIRANDYILTVTKAGFETYERRVRVSESNSEFSVTLERIRAVDDDDDDDSSSDSGSSGSSSGSIGIGGGSGSTTVNSKNQVVASEVNRQIQQGIRDLSAAGKSAVAEVKVKNADFITPEALRSMRLTTEASKGKAKLLADSTSSDGKVAARLYIDPEKSFYVDKEIKLGVSMEEKDIQKTSSTFEKYFDNNVSVVHFDHQGAFGMDIEAAVKVDLSKLNTQNLMFYSYNAATNRYTPIAAPNASIDKNGFLHFTTSLGGDLIITDKPLTPRS